LKHIHDHCQLKDLRLDYIYKNSRGNRQALWKRKKTNNIPNPVAQLTAKHQSHKKYLEESGMLSPLSDSKATEESPEDSDKISSGESSSIPESEIFHLPSDTEEIRLLTSTSAGNNIRDKKRLSNITMTTAQQIQEKRIPGINLKLMNSLIGRQQRENQVRQLALKLKFNYSPDMDDDVWDWNGSSPRHRGDYLRGVIARREYPNLTDKKKVKKFEKKESIQMVRPESSTSLVTVPKRNNQIKRTKRAHTGDSITQIKSPQSSPNIVSPIEHNRDKSM